MSAAIRAARPLVVFLVAGLAACSGAPHREAPPSDTNAPASGDPQIQRSQPAVKPAGSALDAVTRQKVSDESYIQAIAELEVASGAKDAAADLAAGRRQVLGIPRPSGSSRLPGVTIAREQLPNDVAIVKVAGFVDGTTNRHAMRYGLLAEKYVTDYNETMVRAVTR
jgi:hypothetical protein